MNDNMQIMAELIHENFMDMYQSCIIASEEAFPVHAEATEKLIKCLYAETSNMVEVFNDILHEYISEIRSEYQQGNLFDV